MKSSNLRSVIIILVASFVVVTGIFLAALPQVALASTIRVIGDNLGIYVEGESPLFEMTNMAPGERANATVLVSNQGEHEFFFTLSTAKESGSQSLWDKLHIDVYGNDDFHHYSGPLSGLQYWSIATLAVGEEENLTLSVQFPESAGNQFQGAELSLSFTFNATQNKTFNIVVTASHSEGGTVTGSGNYGYGDMVIVTAVPNEGWKFVNWTENGQVVSTDAIYSFENTGARQLVANFTREDDGMPKTGTNVYWLIPIGLLILAVGILIYRRRFART